MVAVVVALLSVVLVGILAFVADLGLAYANQRRQQAAVDATVLAVGQRVAALAPGTDGCAAVVARYGSDVQVRAYAQQVFAGNVTSDAVLAPGPAGLALTCENVGSNPQTLVVRARGTQTSPSFFGGVLGVGGVPVSVTARAVVGPVGTAVGLRPFAICATTAATLRAAPTSSVAVAVDNADAGCGAAAGSWSLLDFDGGFNGTGDLGEWIRDGYTPAVTASASTGFDGDPGFNVNALSAEMDAMMTTRDILLPVFDTVSGSGSNARFHLVGFLSATPCRYRINNQTGPDPSRVNPSCGAAPYPAPNDYLQLRYSRYVPVGSLNPTCSLGVPTCDTGPRIAVLAD
jgi:hypothetical protein